MLRIQKSVQIEQETLQKMDIACKILGWTRSKFINRYCRVAADAITEKYVNVEVMAKKAVAEDVDETYG